MDGWILVIPTQLLTKPPRWRVLRRGCCGAFFRGFMRGGGLGFTCCYLPWNPKETKWGEGDFEKGPQNCCFGEPETFFSTEKPRLAGSTLWFLRRIYEPSTVYQQQDKMSTVHRIFSWQAINILYVISCFLELFIFFVFVFVFFLR